MKNMIWNLVLVVSISSVYAASFLQREQDKEVEREEEVPARVREPVLIAQDKKDEVEPMDVDKPIAHKPVSYNGWDDVYYETPAQIEQRLAREKQRETPEETKQRLAQELLRRQQWLRPSNWNPDPEWKYSSDD